MAINFGSLNTAAVSEYFVKRFNLIGRDNEYTKNRWTLQHMPRDTEKLKQSNGFYETLKIGGGRSGSPDWVTGMKYHKPSKRARWLVEDPYPQYGHITFDSLFLQRNSLGTILDVKGSEAEEVKEGMLNDTEYDLWSNGAGALGRIGTLGGTAAVRLVTLETASDVFNFEFGQVVVADTGATGAGTAHDDVYEVTDLDPVGGKVTFTRLTDASDAWLANDYIFIAGSKGVRMPGIPTFIPSTDPADTLLGVTRTANPATSGWRFTFKASIAETISRSFSFMGRWVERAAKKYVVCVSTMDWLLLSMEREGKAAPSDPVATQKWGLEALAVRTAFGTIHVVAVDQLADGRGYIIDFTSWKLYTLRNLPHVIDEDGQMFTRGGDGTVSGNEHLNGDMIKMKFRLWKILLCLKPMSNATFPTRAS